MKVLKFKIENKYYDQFKEICDQDGITIKRKLNVLMAEDHKPNNILSYLPETHFDDIKKITLKVNEELYKGVMKQCGKNDFNPRDYLAYLIYKFLSDHK
jgi:hypothetical protein